MGEGGLQIGYLPRQWAGALRGTFREIGTHGLHNVSCHAYFIEGLTPGTYEVVLCVSPPRCRATTTSQSGSSAYRLATDGLAYPKFPYRKLWP